MKDKRIFSKMDKPLLIMCLLYSIIGVFLVLSASSVSAVLRHGETPYYFFFRQMFFVFSGYLLGFLFITKVPTKHYSKFIPPALLVLLVALIGLLLFGELINSSKSWYNLGFFSVQPSEFAKTILIIYFGVFFGSFQNKKVIKNTFLIPIVYSIIIVLLTLFQPDLGTAAIIGGTVLLMFISIPFDKNSFANILKILGGGLIIFLVIIMLSGSSFLTKEQLSRLNYKAPCTRYIDETGYQVCNGFIAINNGGLFGKGIGNSTQKYLYLPEAHTDFIFPIAIEELGVIFGVAMILGYLFILYRILLIAKGCYNLRNSIICYGVLSYILLHLIINFCGILALTPLTGVPLPFLSYGGSFTLNLIGAVFIVQRICIENKITKKNIEISKI